MLSTGPCVGSEGGVEGEPAQGSWLDTLGLGGSAKESKRGWKVVGRKID